MTNLNVTITDSQKTVLTKAVRVLTQKIANDLKTLKSPAAKNTAQMTIDELSVLEKSIENARPADAPRERKQRAQSDRPRNSSGIYPQSRGPIMNINRGRHWIEVPMIMQDGSKATCFYDKVFGSSFYFQVGEDWFKAKISEFNASDDADKIMPDLRKRKRA